MSRWTFYSAAHSCGLATHIALHEANAQFDLVKIDFKSQEQQSPEYLRVNPKGRVPALVTSHGILTETPALLSFVAQSHPDALLAPLDDPFALAQIQELMSYLASTVHVAHAHKPRASRWADDPAAQAAMVAKVTENMAACADYLESRFVGPWALGDDYTIADTYLFTVTRWIRNDGVDLSRYPKLADHLERVTNRPATQRALSEIGTS